ncbi:DUF4097 family beta strand repeat-containing protein [Agrococcus sp. ARC_14]|uniref:DUF4097 family beta strand repeat-containing protein n=1 Tax=Agrococcus sp. ARC_14 TaxID=2919927 RepID=UPI001F064A76|nr:DUF4097 family beta strand repeat-containing protein [Agrococcus sp. ARC_14]MCH1883407.1 DUF4097 domain-containing protein [Agrococcus sp. ARC_14]
MTIPTPTATNRPGRWISILVIVLGAIGIVYGVGSGVVRGFSSHAATSNGYTADAAGVEELRIDSSAAAFEIRFDDVDQARLDVTSDGGPTQEWRLSREGSTLEVDTDWRWHWFGFGVILGDRVGEERAVLTLPAALERQELGLDVQVASGSFETAGDWGTTAIDLSAGDVDLTGTAESLSIEVAAGEARIDVATTGAVDLDVSAGRVVGALTGEQPASIDARVSAGSIELTIPDGEYAVTEQVSAGDSEVRVVDDPSAASTIDVEVSAGHVSLRGDAQ